MLTTIISLYLIGKFIIVHGQDIYVKSVCNDYVNTSFCEWSDILRSYGKYVNNHNITGFGN